MNDFIDEVKLKLIDHEKAILEMQQILVLLVKRGAVNLSALSEGEQRSVMKFISEWLGEWRKEK
jgi:hypothetical protein